MICVLMMAFVLINGIENAEHKNRLRGTVLRDDLDGNTKAWLLMVESGKVDDDHVRKITPKSIFIAPLLTSRSNKCKEGYRHDHLGQCVKVIKVDQRAQLEMLLKRLSAIYSDSKSEQNGLSEISSGPLHFSLPITGDNGTTNGTEQEEVDDSTTATEITTTILPAAGNETDDFDYLGTFNESDAYDGSGWESSGFGDTTEYSTLPPDEPEFAQTTEAATENLPYTTDGY